MEKKEKVGSQMLLQILVIAVLFGWFFLSIDVFANAVPCIRDGKGDVWTWTLTIGAVVAAISSLLVPFLWKGQVLSTEECNRHIKMNLLFWLIWTVEALVWKFFILQTL